MKNIKSSNKSNTQKFIKYLQKLEYDFIVSTTLNTTIIKYTDNYSKKQRIFTNGFAITYKEIALQKELKKEVDKNLKTTPISYSNDRIDYYKFDNSLSYMVDTEGECIEIPDIYEMDITSAYYQSLYNLKYIGKRFFEKCKNLPKHIRLRLIGSLATRKLIEKYKKGVLVGHEEKVNPVHRQVYFHNSYQVGKVMLECAKAIQDHFIFYWVDGIYFQRDLRSPKTNDPCIQVVKSIFEKNNFSFSVIELNKITLQNIKNNIVLRCWKDKKLKSMFSVPKNSVKQYVFENEYQKL